MCTLLSMIMTTVCFYVVVTLFSCTCSTALASDCDKFGTCSQGCHETDGFVECSCIEGFTLGLDNKSCEWNDSTWKLLYATNEEVEVIEVSKNASRKGQVTSIVHNPAAAVGVTFDAENEVIYWTDTQSYEEGVYKTTLNGSGTVERIVDTGLLKPEGIAFDWITGNLYLADSNLSQILVCREEPVICVVLLEESIDKPRDIALHPNLGLMFWTDWGDVPKVMGAGMDGAFETVVVSTGLKWPNGIALDEANSRLYWVDAGLDKIETCLFDGSDRQLIPIPVKSKHPFGIDVLGDRLVWSDWSSSDIKSVNKFTGKELKIHYRDRPKYFSGLAALHKVKQPKLRSNPCEIANCSHVCTLSSDLSTDRFKCLCPQGMLLEFANTCMEDKSKPKLLVAFQNTLAIAHVNRTGKDIFKHVGLPSEVSSISAIVYSSRNHSIIMSVISSSGVNQIAQYDLTSMQYVTIVSENLRNVTAMDIDAVSENLYWIDSKTKRVEALSLRTCSRIVLLEDVDNLLDILFVQETSALYLSKPGSIYKLMFGEQNSVTVFTYADSKEHCALVYDQLTQQILWVSHNSIILESASIKDEPIIANKAIYTESELAIQDMIKIGSQIYWVDASPDVKVMAEEWLHFRSLRTNLTSKSDSSLRKMIILINANVSYMHPIQSDHECSPTNLNRKLCSHICLPTKEKLSGECRCPDNMVISSDRVTCVEIVDKEKLNGSSKVLIICLIVINIILLGCCVTTCCIFRRALMPLFNR